ncbi:thioesterase [Paracoccus sp. S-4012]|uniref:thioesterase family protein n=1 Tax=Paracoccus sp. S-4012 TaxID=2665648 RepID=UPI0012B0577F|nr:thioesterase family protein [Paracoccus sp. S-4012]MRX50605.1 thioesterase [Paracoccus sp. S-4012]
MKPGLEPGARARHEMVVEPSHLVPALLSEQRDGAGAFPGLPPVFATAQMVALMEWACLEQMRPFQEEGETSLGVHVDFDHAAPTLPGQTITVETEVEEVDGRFIWFRVEAHDGVERIGGGRHRRAVVRSSNFTERLAAKRAAAGL